MTSRCLPFFLLLVAATGATAQAPVLRYGQAMSAHKSIFSLPIAVAEREELFKREGLDFRVVIPQPGGGERMIAALHDGTVDVTHVATPFLVRAALAGSDAVAIAAEFNNPIYTLVGRPEIARIGDLKGRVVGMADPAGSISFSIRKLWHCLGCAGRHQGAGHRRHRRASPACGAANVPQCRSANRRTCSRQAIACSDTRPKRCRSSSTRSPPRRSWAAANRDAVVRYVPRSPRRSRSSGTPRRATVVQTIVMTGVGAAVAERTLELASSPA